MGQKASRGGRGLHLAEPTVLQVYHLRPPSLGSAPRSRDEGLLNNPILLIELYHLLRMINISIIAIDTLAQVGHLHRLANLLPLAAKQRLQRPWYHHAVFQHRVCRTTM